MGRKYNLAATSDPELGREDMVMLQINDMFERMIVTAYYKQPYASDEAFQKELVELATSLHTYLEVLEKYLQPNHWLTGEKLSYVDFLAYEIIDWYRELVQKDCLSKYTKLSAYMKRFEGLDRLKDYLASDAYRKDAIFGPFASFGNKRKD